MRKRPLARRILAGLCAAILALQGAHIALAQTGTATVTTTTMPFAFLADGDLGVGSRGTSVSGLQGFLSEQGFLTIPRGVAPGYFGTLTQDALVRYQRSLGITSTGKLDATSRSAIVSHLSSRYPSLAWAWGGTGMPGSVASNAPTMRPLGQTGYWQGGSWYSSVPTTTDSGITGYWQNGVWYPLRSTTSTGSVAQGNLGYWYNGVWYPAASSQGGGYFSTNPATSNVSGGNTMGYWYNGVWYPTNISNIGGGQSSDTISSGTATSGVSSTGMGYWQNGVWYSIGPASGQMGSATSSINYSSNLTPTGYWQNGTWYASVPTQSQATSAGIPGYWQNNIWYSIDSSQVTAYGTPNPTSTTTGNGYWLNGIWYSLSSQ